MMTEKLNYGQEITIGEANKIIRDHQDLNRMCEEIIKPCVSNDVKDNSDKLTPRMKEFLKRENNTFIFHKDLITRFFDNEDKSLNAEYLVIVLGAHPKEMVQTKDFKDGSFTVVTAGCNLKKDEKGVLSLQTLKLDKPANEYPPKMTSAELIIEESTTDKSITDTYMKFTLIE